MKYFTTLLFLLLSTQVQAQKCIYLVNGLVYSGLQGNVRVETYGYDANGKKIKTQLPHAEKRSVYTSVIDAINVGLYSFFIDQKKAQALKDRHIYSLQLQNTIDPETKDLHLYLEFIDEVTKKIVLSLDKIIPYWQKKEFRKKYLLPKYVETNEHELVDPSRPCFE